MRAKDYIEKKLYITQDDIALVQDTVDNVEEAMVNFANIKIIEFLGRAREDIKKYSYDNCGLNMYFDSVKEEIETLINNYGNHNRQTH